MIVVDDGSTDGMTAAAQAFAEGREQILVIRRDRRGGKSSALNMGLHDATAEIVITLDADSKLFLNSCSLCRIRRLLLYLQLFWHGIPWRVWLPGFRLTNIVRQYLSVA